MFARKNLILSKTGDQWIFVKFTLYSVTYFLYPDKILSTLKVDSLKVTCELQESLMMAHGDAGSVVAVVLGTFAVVVWRSEEGMLTFSA